VSVSDGLPVLQGKKGSPVRSSPPEVDYANRLEQARLAQRERRLDDAAQAFRALMESDPTREGGLAGLADVAHIRKDWGDAVQYWAACIERFSDSPSAFRWRRSHAWALLHVGRGTEAEPIFRTVLEKQPDDKSAAEGLGRSLMAQQRWAEATALWETLIQRETLACPPGWQRALGRCLENCGRIEEAADAYRAVIHVNPTHLPALRTYSGLLHRLGRTEEAVVATAQAIEMSPHDSSLRLQALRLTLLQQDMAEAPDIWRGALETAREVFELEELFRLIPSVYGGWDRTQAWTDLERTLKLRRDGNSADAIALRMRIRLALRDYGTFLELYDEYSERTDHAWYKRFKHIVPVFRRGQSVDIKIDSNRAKVFGIGLTKTGTTSLTAALEILGYRTAHYTNGFTNEMLRLEDAVFFDALTDSPVCAMFETLYHMFPFSKFIYTKRSIESWCISKEKHSRRRMMLGDMPGGFYYSLYCRTLWAPHESDVAANRAYEARVRNFFAANDPTRLLEFDVFAGDGWEKLCSFLGVSAPEQPFPHENAAPPVVAGVPQRDRPPEARSGSAGSDNNA
jgi:tetratricopeptide (TPR) repeat protein